jgi:tetratricopeptide (TPR) repeat protein
MKRLIPIVALTAAAAVLRPAPATAQLEGVYIPPQCDIETKHFLVKQAALYVKSATEERNPEKQNQNLQDAFRVLQDALGRGEEGNPNVWYFLGRAYALVPDLPGADSAFGKVESMLPDCAEDTDSQRYNLWVPIYNKAVEALQANDYEAAKIPLTEAGTIYHKEPYVPFYLGTIWAQQSTPDSAIKYFKQTIGMAVDTGDYKEIYDLSVFNTARLYHQKEMYDSAIVYYEAYRELNPSDPTATTGLAAAYEAAGNTEGASRLFGEILAAADSMSALDLFSTGVSLFNQEEFETAAMAFGLGVQKNPYHRDGLYNLTQSWYAVASPDAPEVPEGQEPPQPTDAELAKRGEAADSMLSAAKRLVGVDPQNEDSQRLLAAAWQLQGNDDSTLAVIYRLDSLQFDISVFRFNQTGAQVDVAGEIRNRKDQEITVPAIQFDFIDSTGAVVASDTFPGTTLAPEQSTEFAFKPVGETIAAWRYSFATQGTEP